MFEIPVGVNKCWNARDTFKNKGSLLFRFKFLIKNAGYRGSLIILLTQGLFLGATLWDFAILFGKKCHIKFTLPHQMGHKKMDPRISTFFKIKYSKTGLTTALI